MRISRPLLLNGQKPGKKELKQFVDALSDPRVLTASGGYLFKSRLDNGTLHIGIVPAISEGQRLHHYDVSVPEGRHILGIVSAEGEFSLLFKEKDADSEALEEWRLQYRAFAGTLLSAGYTGEGRLDWITSQIFSETGMFSPIPATLADLASR